MTVDGQIRYYSRRGTIHYTPGDSRAEKVSVARLPEPPFRPRQFRPRSIHITRFPAGSVFFVPPSPPKPLPNPKYRSGFRKLASRETAKRVLGSVFPSLVSSASGSNSTSTPDLTRSLSPQDLPPAHQSPPGPPAHFNNLHNIASNRASISGPVPNHATMPASTGVRGPQSAVGGRNSFSGTSNRSSPSAAMATRPPNVVYVPEADRPIATATGVSCSILLDEPHVYLTGFDHDRNHPPNSTAMIRGTLVLDVTKSTKIKTVTLTFVGKARTEWPEGTYIAPSFLTIH